MKRQRKLANYYSLYSDATEPMLPGITTPMPAHALPQQAWISRAVHAIGAFFAAIINKMMQALALILAVLLLLLFARFMLSFFHLSLSSQFSYWVFFLSAPLVAPFENLLPSLPYNGYTIDVSTLLAIVIYALGVTIVRQFLKILVGR